MMKPRVASIIACLAFLAVTPLRAQIGAFQVSGGLAQGLESGGLGTQPVLVSSFSLVASRFSFGPEGLFVPGEKRIYGIGGVARVQLSAEGLQPYLILGFGGNYWRQGTFVEAGLFSVSGGAGIAVGKDDRLVLEARLYDSLQNIGGPQNWAFLTMTGGVRFRW